MKHILLITTSFPEMIPGKEAAGSFVSDLAQILGRNHAVTVVSPGGNNEILDDESCRVVRFQVNRLPLSLIRPINPANWFHIYNIIRSGQQACERVIQSKRPDHIIALWALPSGYWAYKLSKQYNIDYSVWALGSDIWSLSRIPLVKNILRKILRHASHRYADGRLLGKQVEKICSLKCEFLPSSRRLPVSVCKEQKHNQLTRFAFLGRWHTNKGIDLLLDAITLLSEEDWSKIEEIRIYGGGPMSELVNRKARELLEQHRPISIGGYIDKYGAAELLCWTDYLIIPSRIESIPVVFSDALQLKKPVISTPVGDMTEILSKYKAGILLKDKSPAAIRDGIKKAISERPSEFENGIEKAAAEFSLDTVVSLLSSRI